MTILHLTWRLLALGSLAVLVLSGWLIWSWWDAKEALEAVDPLAEPDNTRLVWGLALLAWSLLGRWPLALLLGRGGGQAGRLERSAIEPLNAADGSRIAIDAYGPPDAPSIILTHGWGMDATSWVDIRRRLDPRYRVITWDLPGLGRSTEPADGRYSVERFAANLAEVLQTTRGPALLAGHSIGGMIVQTFLRDYPDLARERVTGVVLINTTHTNPVRTTALSGLLTALQRPIIEPVMRLDIWLSPLVWLMNWQSYLSGSTHLAMRFSGFGTQPQRTQLNHTSLLATRNSPKVQAKGNLAMMRWGVTNDLPNLFSPALVVIGGRDLVTRPHAGDHIAAALPAARAERVSKAGHMGTMEFDETYSRAIAAFADEVLMKDALSADAQGTTAQLSAESPARFVPESPVSDRSSRGDRGPTPPSPGR